MKTRFAIAGAKGWRAQFYLRIARMIPDEFEVCAIYETNGERAEIIRKNWDLPIAGNWDELRAYDPEFLVACVRGSAMPDLITEAVREGFYVLSETFWPASAEALEQFYRSVPDPSRVQVAEQYRFQSHHASLLRMIQMGYLGEVGQVQLSSCHGYHAASLIRLYLGIGMEPFTVTGRRMQTPTLKGPGRGGYPETEEIRQDSQDLAVITFDETGKWALFDWTDESYFSPIRKPRILLRGSRGEADNHVVRYMRDERTPVDLPFVRISGGAEGELSQPCLDSVYLGENRVFRHPWPGVRMMDEEIAVACVLRDMGIYARGGSPCYSLEEGCQDQYLALLMREACRDGRTVRSGNMPWMGKEN